MEKKHLKWSNKILCDKNYGKEYCRTCEHPKGHKCLQFSKRLTVIKEG